MTKEEAMSRLLGLIYFLQDENLLTQDEVSDINQAYNVLIPQPDAETLGRYSMGKVKILACSNCGDRSAVWDNPDENGLDFEIECIFCEKTTGWVKGREKAIEKWNSMNEVQSSISQKVIELIEDEPFNT